MAKVATVEKRLWVGVLEEEHNSRYLPAYGAEEEEVAEEHGCLACLVWLDCECKVRIKVLTRKEAAN